MIHDLERNTHDTYIYRVYAEPLDIEYKFAMPVCFRGNGAFECHAWNSVFKWWPESQQIYGFSGFAQIIEWIEMELQKVEPRFRYIIGTFELDRLRLYKRLFRSIYKLETINVVSKWYNGRCWDFAIVRFGHYLFGTKEFRYMWE